MIFRLTDFKGKPLTAPIFVAGLTRVYCVPRTNVWFAAAERTADGWRVYPLDPAHYTVVCPD